MLFELLAVLAAVPLNRHQSPPSKWRISIFVVRCAALEGKKDKAGFSREVARNTKNLLVKQQDLHEAMPIGITHSHYPFGRRPASLLR
jgi:hypothetical protein